MIRIILMLCLFALIEGFAPCTQPGDMQCVSDTMYQTCADIGGGSLGWIDNVPCKSGLMCLQAGNSVYCAPQNSALPCPEAGYMKCTGKTMYSTCSYNSNIKSLTWGNDQSCGKGLVCSPSGNYVYCKAMKGGNKKRHSNCDKIGDMECTSSDTYHTCTPTSTGSIRWSEDQDCQEGLRCYESEEEYKSYCA